MMTVATIQADARIERMAIAARDAGCPRDQTERFVQAGYVPLVGMLPFHAAAREADSRSGPEWIALGGKRGPGKTHAVMAQVGLDDCQRVPELKVLFLRKIMKSAAESLGDVVGKVFLYTPHTFNRGGVDFSNGSNIVIGGFKDEKDIEKYLGLEYDIIVLEECTQISETKKDHIRGSLRTSKTNWRPRIYLTTNADGIGLLWFKKMFVEPFRAGLQKLTRFFDVTKIHNPFINAEYETWLDSLTGALRKAWRDGDWDAFAGMAFPQWNQERHVIAPFEIPTHWLKWRATDWGQAAPFCTLWATKDPDTRRIYVYRELYQAGLTDRQQARYILDMTPGTEQIFISYADPALWSKKNFNDQVFSTADEYKNEGIILTKADNDRLSGKRKVSNLLADLPDGEPGIQFFDTCPHITDQLGSLASDKRNPEDVDCFVAGTLVSTPSGLKSIETLRLGDMVDTPIGPQPVVKDGISGVANVIKVQTSEGYLEGTPNHKVYVRGKGLIQMADLQIGDILIKKNISLTEELCIKSRNTEIQEKLFKIFQKVGTFITKIIIQLITIPKTLKYLTLQLTPASTSPSVTLTQPRKINLTDGAAVLKEKSNSRETQRRCENIPQSESLRVRIVGSLLQHDTRLRSVALISAKCRIKLLNSQSRFAKFVGNLSGLWMSRRPPAHIVAAGSYEGRKQVYNMTVARAHLYYANGVLVTNTDQEDHAYDTLKYLLTNERKAEQKPPPKPQGNPMNRYFTKR